MDSGTGTLTKSEITYAEYSLQIAINIRTDLRLEEILIETTSAAKVSCVIIIVITDNQQEY